MTSGLYLSALSVALILVGVAVLALLAAFFTEGRKYRVFTLCLLAIWLLACIVAFVVNPSWWPSKTF